MSERTSLSARGLLKGDLPHLRGGIYVMFAVEYLALVEPSPGSTLLNLLWPFVFVIPSALFAALLIVAGSALGKRIVTLASAPVQGPP